MELFKEMHKARSFTKALNSTFLVLIAKVEGVVNVKEFLPISLVGCAYKFIAKVVVRRMVEMLGKVVRGCQNAFVEGRQIVDVVMMASEVVDDLHSRRRDGVLCKLNVEKAYDHINWGFMIIC